MSNHKRRWAVVAVAVLALAALACSTASLATPTPTPTSPPTFTPSPVPTKTPTPKPTPTSPPKPTFGKLTFAAGVDTSGDTFKPINPGASFSDLKEVHAVFDYTGMVDGRDFRRVWTRDGKVTLDKTSAWDSGESGQYHLSLYVDSGTLDAGNYKLELYFDGKLLQSGTFTLKSSSGVLFQDDFSNVNSGWTVAEGDNTTKSYQNGKYVITIKNPGYYGWGVPGQSFEGGVMIDVDATMTSGPEDNNFGILCHYQDEDNFYYLTISSDGYAGIVKEAGGDAAKIISSSDGKLHTSSAVKKGKGATNHIRAICDVGKLTLIVNGTKAFEVEDSDFRGGDVGLRADAAKKGGVVISFDNFVVSSIK